ncbi:MAG TPA: delta-60 repeat domain-containing protein [Treponemataceae bacterium]|nr:delta-60 repeat domain-containing protein [Treponemataceae bacterium]
MIPQIIAVQSDGKILVGGMYVSADGTSGANGSHLARLSSDGSLDTSFNPGTGLDDEAHQKYGPECMLVQADDSIMIGGYFTTVNGVRRNRVARLNPDGSLDETFDPGDGAGNGIVEAICPVSDGYLVAGYFSRFGNLNRGRIVKVSKNGATDAAWHASGSGADDAILSITALPGGQFMIVGDFTSYDGVARNHIARINSDGTLDTAFNPASSFDLTNTSTHSVDIRSVSMDSSGRVYIGGGFPNYAIRCNADGSLDSTFPAGAGFNGIVTAIVPQDDGKILVAGYFSTVNGSDHPVFVRLNSDGSVDSGFNKVTNLNGTALTFPSSIMFAVQNNGMIVSCANTGVIRIYP